MRLCDAYSIPVVTVVNTEGFVKSEGDDQAGGIRQAARMAGVYAEATTVKAQSLPVRLLAHLHRLCSFR